MKTLSLVALTACAGMFADTGTLSFVPVRKTSDLESLVGKLPDRYAELRPDSKLLYVYLADADWSYARHEISGLILRREVSGVFAYQHKDGTCGVELLSIGQTSLGPDEFGPLRVYNVSGPDGYPRYLYRPGQCSEILSIESTLRAQGCAECVVSEPAPAPPAHG